MPLEICLIGENHVLDDDNRHNFQELCNRHRVLCAVEHVRMCPKYENCLSDIGDYIANLYSAVALILLYLNNGLEPEPADIDFFELYAEYIHDDKLKGMEPLFQSRYGSDFSISKLKQFFLQAQSPLDIKNITPLFTLINAYINNDNWFLNANIQALNPTAFTQPSDLSVINELKKQLIHDLRNPAFLRDIKDLVSLAHNNSKPQLFIVVGRAHLKELGKQLIEKSDEWNIRVKIFQTYPVVTEYNNETGSFVISRQLVEQELSVKIIQAYCRGRLFSHVEKSSATNECDNGLSYRS